MNDDTTQTMIFAGLAGLAAYIWRQNQQNGRSGSATTPLPNINVRLPASLEEAATSARTLSTGSQDHGSRGSATTSGNMTAEGETTDILTRSKRRRLFAGVE